MSYATAFGHSQDTAFRQRITIAIAQAAVAIMAEAANVTHHAKRVALAARVVENPASFVDAYAIDIVSDDATTINSTDAQLQTRVNALWNAWAGASL